MTTKIISFTCIICLLCCFSLALAACQSEQTPGVVDAPVNSGNSGGGLFDGQGKLIGIVNANESLTDVL